MSCLRCWRREYAQVQGELKAIEAKLMAWHRANAAAGAWRRSRVSGRSIATALVMKTPDPRAFRSGRHFAAWLGLTPKDHSTAGKTRLGKITRAGDETLRSLLVVGATAVIQQAQHEAAGHASPWLLALLERKPPKLAAVALANKMARIAWKLMVTGESYDARGKPRHGARRLTRSADRRARPTGRAGAARGADGRIDRSEVRDTPWDPMAEHRSLCLFGTRVAETILASGQPTASTGRTYGCKRSDQTVKNSCGTGAVHIWVLFQRPRWPQGTHYYN